MLTYFPPSSVNPGRALFWYLELSIGKTLKWLYPTAPDRADAWLAEEIYRWSRIYKYALNPLNCTAFCSS